MTSVENHPYESLDPATQAALDALAEKLNRATSWKPEEKGERCAGLATASPLGDGGATQRREEALRSSDAHHGDRADDGLDVQQAVEDEAHQARDQHAGGGRGSRVLGAARAAGRPVVIEYGGELPHPTEEGQTYKRFIIEISRPVAGATARRRKRRTMASPSSPMTVRDGRPDAALA